MISQASTLITFKYFYYSLLLNGAALTLPVEKYQQPCCLRLLLSYSSGRSSWSSLSDGKTQAVESTLWKQTQNKREAQREKQWFKKAGGVRRKGMDEEQGLETLKTDAPQTVPVSPH